MSLLEVTDLSHTFGEKALYKDASFALYKGEHAGVVGQNGTGKSTLIKILTGEVVPDVGQVKWQPGSHIGHLSQYAEADGSICLEAYLHTAFAGLYRLEKQMAEFYEEYVKNEEESLLARAAECQEALESGGFYEIDSRIARMASGLGLTAYGMDTPVGELSGGQRAKVILAKLLLEQADVLLLDEPTNFLDKAHIDWLTGYLAGFPGAFVVVSHDSQFLEDISDCILDIEFESIRKYHGGYSDFLRQKKQLREDYIRQYNSQQKKIELTEEYIRRNKAGVNSKMARGRQKQLDRLERIAPPSFTFRPVIRFLEQPLSAQNPLEVENLVIGYEHPLLPRLNFVVEPGQKLVITGFNGIGKSTLLKTLMGFLPPVAGSYQFTETTRIGYYEQELSWDRTGQTPLEILADAYPRMNPNQLRRQLAQCGVKAEHFDQPVTTLSGGEQCKVKLCRLLLSPVNFLILDEVTNHLDVETKQVLREALTEFTGSVILVSHEAEFYQGWADRVFRIDEYQKERAREA